MAVKASDSITVASIIDVASTTRWYLLQSSTLSAPAKPTANPPGGAWSSTEPTYTDGSTNSLYTCDMTVFSDGTYAYSAVSLSSSYEASKAAYNKAVAAQAAATAAQTFIATCSTVAATAAKAVTGVTGFSLASGVCIAVVFSNANTAASPTLNVNSTGAKPIMLNGAAYAYWVAGTTVQFVYDGTAWQVCNVPLYGATATIGNPTSKNIYIDSDSIDFRQTANVIGSLGIEAYAETDNLLSLLCGANYDGVKVGGGAYAILDQRVTDATYGCYGSSVTCGMHEENAPRLKLHAYRGEGTVAHPIDKKAEIDVGVDAGGNSYINLSADKISVLDWKLVGTQVGTTHVSIPTTAREIFVDARAAFNSAANWSFLFVAPMLTTTPVLQIQGWYTDPGDCGNVSVFATNTEVWLFSLQLVSTHYESSSTIHVYYR